MTMFPLAQKSGYIGFKKAQITHLLNSCFRGLGIKIQKARDTALASFHFPQKAVKVFLVLQALAQTHSLPTIPLPPHQWNSPSSGSGFFLFMPPLKHFPRLACFAVLSASFSPTALWAPLGEGPGLPEPDAHYLMLWACRPYVLSQISSFQTNRSLKSLDCQGAQP